MENKRVAAIHDLSGFGRCSLTAAIPILAAMGAQPCPLPTAVLSHQTGFAGYACKKLSAQMEANIGAWEAKGERFQGIYTGFLADEAQAALTAEFIRTFREDGTLVLVDPVLGDGGALYPVFAPSMVDAVRELVADADILTPNLTEACCLSGVPWAGRSTDLGCAAQAAGVLRAMGAKTVVVTGLVEENSLCNAVFSGEGSFTVCNPILGEGRSGTGDVFASVVCGGMMKGMELADAIRLALTLIEAGIREAVLQGLDPNEGIPFEHHLHLLINEEEKQCATI